MSWYLTRFSADPSSGGTTAYRKSICAFRDAADLARQLAQDELGLVFDENDEEEAEMLKLLRDTIKAADAGDYHLAVENWLEYADLSGTQETFTLEEGEIVD